MAAGFFGLQRLSRATSSLTLPPMDPSVTSQIPMRQIRAYGPPLPDPRKIFDLPKGFRYTVLARKGEPMDDGLLVPGDQDGMAAFELPDGRLALVCNHELNFSEVDDGPFGPEGVRNSLSDYWAKAVEKVFNVKPPLVEVDPIVCENARELIELLKSHEKEHDWDLTQPLHLTEQNML